MRRDGFWSRGAPSGAEEMQMQWIFVAPTGGELHRGISSEIPKGGLKEGRTEEFATVCEDFGLGDDEVVADDFEKLSLHGENVAVVEYVGNLGPMLVDHGGIVDELVGWVVIGERDTVWCV